MSARADAIREQQWRDRGGGRLTMRISGAANAEIDRMARVHRCSRRDVIEGLLLGTLRLDLPPEVSDAMKQHRLSRAEAEAFVGVFS